MKQSDHYKEAGVDVEAGYAGIKKIKPLAKATAIDGVMEEIGSFGALFDLAASGLKEPVLVSGTDGVGTKLLIAMALQKFDTVGIDCVAMCANDVLAQGAWPLFFLDYLALGKNDPELVEQLVKGVAEGCKQAGCALIGGETAEMPGLYGPDDFDMAGFCVGAMEKSDLKRKEQMKPGDVLIALASNGIHSNGYTLVRKILSDHKLSLQENYQFAESLGKELLGPTRIYVPEIKALKAQGIVPLSMANITGGGLYENIPRMFPQGLNADLTISKKHILPIFEFLAGQDGLSIEEMSHVFNMGIGFVLAIPPEEKEQVLEIFNSSPDLADAFEIGSVIKGDEMRLAWTE